MSDYDRHGIRAAGEARREDTRNAALNEQARAQHRQATAAERQLAAWERIADALTIIADRLPVRPVSGVAGNPEEAGEK